MGEMAAFIGAGLLVVGISLVFMFFDWLDEKTNDDK